jgi:radical SAM protein with 4Fe4S-binding SPASM domain
MGTWQKDSVMPFSQVKELLSSLKSMGCEKIILIGGEPTLHPEIVQILSECREQNIKVSIVSNGLCFASKTFCENVLTAYGEMPNITLSMASFPAENRNLLTAEGRVFEKFEQGFNNLLHYDNNPDLIIVISSTSIQYISDIFLWLATNEIKSVSFSVGVPSIIHGEANGTHTINPQKIGYTISKLFKAGQILGIKTSFRNAPLCTLERKDAEELIAFGAVQNSCGIPNKRNILFNVNGELITCNHLESDVLCQWKNLQDALDENRIEDFWNSKEMQISRNRFPEFPSLHCENCDMWNNCRGGGCPITWTYYNAQDYIKGWSNIEKG